MFHLTKQERLVLITLSFIFLFGMGLHYAFRRFPYLKDMVNMIDQHRIIAKKHINSITYQELIKIPSIGPVTAKRFINYRKFHGPFTALSQIKSIKGIGQENYKSVIRYLRVSN